VYAERDGQPLKLDLYRPLQARGPVPGVLVIHGGSWQGGDQTQLAALNSYLAARGYLVAAITYRLAPAHPFPAAYNDVRDALAFLRANAPDLGLDPSRLALLGRSAGGQLALLAAYRADPPVRGVVSFYGPTDLRWGYANPGNSLVIDSQGTLRAYLGGNPDEVGAQYDAAAPIGFVGPHSPPTLLIHGARDELVSVRHAEFLAERLRANNRPHLLLRLPWATHGCDYNWSGPSAQLSTYAIERFLAAVMR
jgi:acetyl esterase/lipase